MSKVHLSNKTQVSDILFSLIKHLQKNNKIVVIILKKKKINPIKEHCVRKILCMSKSNISTDMYV